MTDQTPPQAPKLRPARVLLLALISAGVALALTLWIGNSAAPRATECPVQADRAAKIDFAAVGELAALSGTGKGRNYADIGFNDAEGKPLTIADFKGKKLLVNFWASWCLPCREEMPALDAIAAKFNSDDFLVLPINTGDPQLEKGKAFLAEGGFEHLPFYTNFELFKTLQQMAVITGLPGTVLLDENGCELAALPGPAEWNTPDGENVVRALLGA
jgi:thiol-disulfide isomerase/thioredoxin